MIPSAVIHRALTLRASCTAGLYSSGTDSCITGPHRSARFQDSVLASVIESRIPLADYRKPQLSTWQRCKLRYKDLKKYRHERGMRRKAFKPGSPTGDKGGPCCNCMLPCSQLLSLQLSGYFDSGSHAPSGPGRQQSLLHGSCMPRTERELDISGPLTTLHEAATCAREAHR